MSLKSFNPVLELRAKTLRAIRCFFYDRDFLEVETPLRIPAPALETHIDAIQWNGESLQLALSGKAKTDVWLRVFHDKGNDCTERFHKIAPFNGTKQVRV